MRKVRTYRMTVASTWYDKISRGVKEYELHFTIARPGKIRNVRRKLAERGVPYFQRLVYRRIKKWIPKRKIRVSFEREEPAKKSESKIRIEGRSMLYRGKRWRAYPLGRWELSYSKRRRRKRGRRKCSKSR